jgi:ribonuclease P protein subunit POP4
MSKMITRENILSHEIIGLKATIEQCSNRFLADLSGRIILETKNMIGIETSRGMKKIPKSVARRIRLDLNSGYSCYISGSSLIGRPEDRISKNR